MRLAEEGLMNGGRERRPPRKAELCGLFILVGVAAADCTITKSSFGMLRLCEDVEWVDIEGVSGWIYERCVPVIACITCMTYTRKT